MCMHCSVSENGEVSIMVVKGTNLVQEVGLFNGNCFGSVSRALV